VVVEEDLAQVVDVGRLRVRQLAEEPGPHHVQDHELVLAVAAVLEHHAMPARALGGVHQAPAVLEGRGRRDLHEHVLPRLHGRHRHGNVPAPRRRDVDDVEVVAADEVLEVRLARGVAGGLLLSGLHDLGLGGGHAVLHEVADGVHLDPGYAEQIVEEARPTSAVSDEPDADDLARLEADADHARARGGRSHRRRLRRLRGRSQPESLEPQAAGGQRRRLQDASS
jgi:hypothetical protein